jgi:polyketide cyclase/dehydrase/lipid transport protein
VIEIEHTAHSTAPRSEVWAKLADIDNWDSWGPWTETTSEGDIRRLVSERKRLSGKPYVMVERVTAMEPEERFEYDLLKGLPIKDYHSVVTLSDAPDGGTDIRWSSTFKSPWPFLSGIWRGSMLEVITDVAERLARA